MANKIFDLLKDSIEKIEIVKNNNGDNCYIRDVIRKGFSSFNIYNGFLLNDKERVQVECLVSFFPSSVNGLFVPRLEFRKINRKTGEAKKPQKEDVIIRFSGKEDGYEQFWLMIGFLYKFKNLVDLGEFGKTYKVINESEYLISYKSKDEAEKVKALSKFISESGTDVVSLALADNRKNIINMFDKLLNQKDYMLEYRKIFAAEIKGAGDESIWHHFLKKNSWLLGLNVDIRFIRDFLSEVHVGSDSSDGSGSPKVDLMGLADYTVLIELKIPATKIFSEEKKNTSRANTWSFSNEFIDGISQCLGQKCDWDKYHYTKQLKNKNEEVIDQDTTRTVDTKTLFIIGRKDKEFPESSKSSDILMMRDTFQRFRRNSRNLEIMTFDELYERAYYIVYNEKPKLL